MNAPAPLRVGWCPGALRPMTSGDGLILRVKPRGGTLSLTQARRIAETSRHCGNGALDLTSRANLQIRGVDASTLDAAFVALKEADLIDPSSAAEAVRNVVSSPLAGLDLEAGFDIRRVVAALERRLTEDVALHALPPKFGIVVDDGGALGLGAVVADIRFVALRGEGLPVFVVTLDGELTEGICAAAALPDAAAALAHIMVVAHRTDPYIRRMRHIVCRDGPEAVFRRAGLAVWRRFLPRPAGAPAIPTRSPVGSGRPGILGVAAPFGHLNAAQFVALSLAADEAGATELRLTPWRAILIPGLEDAARQAASRACAAAGFIVDAADPRLGIAACPGAPGCHRGTTPVLVHAARLAAHLPAHLETGPGGIAVHVSGCGKGCAHAGQAPVTLVGHDGLYDIVVDGSASDAPAVRNLSFEDAERCLKGWFVGERA